MTTPYIFEGKSLVGARGCLLDGMGRGGGEGFVGLERHIVGGWINSYRRHSKWWIHTGNENQLIFLIKRQFQSFCWIYY